MSNTPHRDSVRAANEDLMNERFRIFRDRILKRLDELDTDKAYLDCAIEFNFVKGRLQHAHATEDSEGTRVTDRFKVIGHI